MRGRLYKKDRVKIITDKKIHVPTANYKGFDWWYEDEVEVDLRRIKKKLQDQFNLSPSKTGLLLSWSIRDKTAPEVTFEKYRARLTETKEFRKFKKTSTYKGMKQVIKKLSNE